LRQAFPACPCNRLILLPATRELQVPVGHAKEIFLLRATLRGLNDLRNRQETQLLVRLNIDYTTRHTTRPRGAVVSHLQQLRGVAREDIVSRSPDKIIQAQTDRVLNCYQNTLCALTHSKTACSGVLWEKAACCGVLGVITGL